MSEEIATSNSTMMKIDIDELGHVSIHGQTIVKGGKDFAKLFKKHTSTTFQESFFRELANISDDILPDDTRKISRIKAIIEGEK